MLLTISNINRFSSKFYEYALHFSLVHCLLKGYIHRFECWSIFNSLTAKLIGLLEGEFNDSNLKLVIDIVDRCNIRCPTCPMGNSGQLSKKGNMSPEFLKQVMHKATSESTVERVDLYNWTEPLLHPRLPEMINVIHSFGVRSRLSTNLNMSPKSFDDILSTNTEYMSISVSGFTQPVYGRTHEGGDIERVKNNMAILAEAKKRTKSETKIEVKYLTYLGNVDDAVRMKKYADDLGLQFFIEFAGIMPLEKIVGYITDGKSGAAITEKDKEIFATLTYPHKEMVKLTKPFRSLPCSVLEDWIVLNSKGDVLLCWLVYDEQKYFIAEYLSTPIEKIIEIKRNHWQCKECNELGISIARNYPIPKTDQEILKRFKEYTAQIGLDMDKVHHVSLATMSRIKFSLYLSERLRRSKHLSTYYYKIKKYVPKRFRRYQESKLSKFN